MSGYRWRSALLHFSPLAVLAAASAWLPSAFALSFRVYSGATRTTRSRYYYRLYKGDITRDVRFRQNMFHSESDDAFLCLPSSSPFSLSTKGRP